MKSPPLLILALPREMSFARGVIRGVQRYVEENQLDWAFDFMTFGELEAITPREKIFHPDNPVAGIILHLQKKAWFPYLESLPCPIVNVSRALEQKVFAEVVSDDLAIGRLAAEYFLQKGFVHFAYSAMECHHYSRLRQQGYTERLREEGFSVHTFSAEDFSTKTVESPIYSLPMELLGKKLKALPKPIALFCANDLRAARALEACRRHGLGIPHEIAIMGVDVEEFGPHSFPGKLSSILPGTEAMGYHAAQMIKRQEGKGVLPYRQLTIPPVEIVSGSTTDLFLHADNHLRRALTFIREHYCEPIRVEDVFAHCGVSRRHLERSFKTHLGVTPLAEILRRRLHRARALLLRENSGIEQIALSCGYTSLREFYHAFRRETGLSPTAYRKAYQADPAELVESGVGGD